MDAIDRKILRQLSRDSALTNEALGARVGLSGSAAHRRVKALEQSGAILGYRARLSRAAEDNPSTVFVQVTLTDQKRTTMEAFEAALERASVIREAHLMSGESDYLLKVLVPETDSYERIHRQVLASLPGVHRLVTQFTIRSIQTDEE
jgi:DNA-binding Lrp family transcriptional regulator